MSGMNYFDDDHVVYEVHALISREPFEVIINFPTGEIKPEGEHSPRLLKSIAFYQAGLNEHLRKHNVDPAVLSNVALHRRLTTLGGQTVMLAIDDRDIEHRVVVRN